MLDYVFYYASSLREFTKYLESRSIPFETRDDALGEVVAVPEEIEDATLDEVEICYEGLQRDQEAMLEAQGEGEPGRIHTALTVQLGTGQTVYASVPADLMRRLLTVLRPEEIGQLVDAVAMAVECPDLRPLCRR
jgi:hypothetical protein